MKWKQTAPLVKWVSLIARRLPTKQMLRKLWFLDFVDRKHNYSIVKYPLLSHWLSWNGVYTRFALRLNSFSGTIIKFQPSIGQAKVLRRVKDLNALQRLRDYF